MKNNLSNILLYIFLLNSINIFSLGSDIKEIEPIESIHSDENSSIFVNDNSKSVSESSFEEIYKSKNSTIISTNKDFVNCSKIDIFLCIFFIVLSISNNKVETFF